MSRQNRLIMPNRRILSLWFPRLGAERVLRFEHHMQDAPLAIVAEQSNMQVITSLNGPALRLGLHVGQSLRDAQASCAGLHTRMRNRAAEISFLNALRRWSGKYSPWVAETPPDALVIDLTGCAHLFGGETGVIARIEEECRDMGLTVQCGIADTLGAAWALARFSGESGGSLRNGDAIDQEARATRSRAGKRKHWSKGGAAPQAPRSTTPLTGRIAAPGQNHSALAPLPVTALRLDPGTTEQLNRLGLRHVRDIIGQPRAALARRFGKSLLLRLDQALGSVPEPVSPAEAEEHFAVRMTMPDPIGLKEDVMAALDRMLPSLCKKIQDKGRGLRSLRLEAHRPDGQADIRLIQLARATCSPDRIRPLLEMKIEDLDAEFGIDMLRLVGISTEERTRKKPVGHLQANRTAGEKRTDPALLHDLVSKIGARIGLETVTRRHPGTSHLPDKSALTLAAAWSDPASDWPPPAAPRPLLIWPPEPVHHPASEAPKASFRWRGRQWSLVALQGPERILPEWWFDLADWRTGIRDYWKAFHEFGKPLWIYFGRGAILLPNWFCHGSFP